MKIVGMSDSHNRHKQVIIPECDLLLHAGDMSYKGYYSEMLDFAKWLHKQPAKDIALTFGNHELEVEKDLQKYLDMFKQECPRAHILIDSSVIINGVKIHGTPVSPWFFDWAWNRARDLKEAQFRQIPEIKQHWDKIPEDTNILLTHSPPYGILDELYYVDGTPKGQYVGCEELLKKVNSLKDLDLHLFGHIHASYGERHINGTSFYNVSVCDEMYAPTNPITVIEYNKE